MKQSRPEHDLAAKISAEEPLKLIASS